MVSYEGWSAAWRGLSNGNNVVLAPAPLQRSAALVKGPHNGRAISCIYRLIQRCELFK